MTLKPKIFLIHGLFMHGAIMQYQQRQLRQRGYEVVVFSYRTVKRPLHENARLLAEFVQQQATINETCHFVGHSLGGLLIRLTYELIPSYFTGRIVTMGTPHNGSEVARRVANDIHIDVLGGSYEDALDGDLPSWSGAVELGSIAGNLCIGIGIALKNLERPNDGTVSVSETQLSHQTDHIELPVSHTALIYSQRVVNQIDTFLRCGEFDHRLD